MLSRQELLVPQAQKCNHGNEPGTGSAQGASCGLVAVERLLGLSEEVPRCPPQPHGCQESLGCILKITLRNGGVRR